ncbi:MAG: hypothetical protein RBS77_05505 [Candidatus Moranbacteria bacterium]|jgi:hypothetical protein|nr:hypothetical protein [Candidatus Moranbacteria bacterium]
MKLDLKQQIEDALNNSKTIFIDEYSGIKTDSFIKKVEDTKKAIIFQAQNNKKISLKDLLIIDKLFDEFLENL